MKIILLVSTLAALLLAGGCAHVNARLPVREWPEWGTELANLPATMGPKVLTNPYSKLVLRGG